MSEVASVEPGQLPKQEVMNPNIPDIQEKLTKLQLQGISPEVLSRIQAKPDIQAGFTADLDALLSRTPINANEKAFFENKYIQGYAQEVSLKDGRKLSFSDIRGITNKDEQGNILEEMSEIQYKEYDNWIKGGTQEVKTSTVQETKSNDTGRTVVDSFDELNKKLESSIKSLQEIKGVPNVDITSAREATLKNPPKELQGVSPDKIKNGAYDNIILADHYVTHATEIAKTISPEDQEKFKNSITNISDTLRRERTENWPGVVESKGGLVFGSAREQIKQAGDRIIADGYDKSVSWDPQTRSLIFRGDKGEKIIDTALVPPQERISEGGLSISREMQDIDPNDIKRDQLNVKRSGSVNSIMNVIANDYRPINTDRIPSAMKQKSGDIIARHESLQQEFNNAGDPKSRLAILENLTQNNESLNASYKSSLTTENISSPEMVDMERSLETEKQGNKLLETELKKLIAIDTSIISLPPRTSSGDNFDTIARDNLSWLGDNYFDRMGPSAQEALNRIISSINRSRDKRNQIDLADHTLTPTEQQILTRSLEKLGGTRDVLTSGEKLPSFQAKLTKIVSLPKDNSESIDNSI